jgi:tRNA(Ile)-lysidine synthase
MIDLFNKHIDNNLPFLHGKKLLVCVSGGADSVVLFSLINKMNYTIGVAHCNFKLRHKESDDDSFFVENLCKINSIPFYSKDFDINIPKHSVQMAARKLRYDWFYELLELYKYDFILTAHHLNDSIETFFINLSRSTGIDGLTGIKSINNKVVRPLLPFNKSQIIDYANDNNIKWREDSSNLKDNYLRNKIRNKLVPILSDIDSDFTNNFSKTIYRLNESNLILKEHIQNFKSINFQTKNDEILILPHGEYEINVAHYIYELIALSLPLKRVHPGVEDGTLGSDILKKLEDLSPKCIDNNTPTEDTDPRWEKLKKLITDK